MSIRKWFRSISIFSIEEKREMHGTGKKIECRVLGILLYKRSIVNTSDFL